MTAENKNRRQFASDNYSGICPEAFAALAEANQGHTPGYGNDPWTAKAADLIREVFETKCEVYFVFNGTAANSLSLSALCQSYHSVLCHELAHIENAECAAPEFFANGAKIITLSGAQGKLTPAAIETALKKRTTTNHPKPRALSLTQATEMGTLYSLDELRALTDLAKKSGLHVHMDGARFANAVVGLNVSPKEVTWQSGMDVLSFGGTKNGMAIGEAVVFFNLDLAKEFDYRCKQAGQVASKMRFLSASWAGILQNGAWLRHARHANAMAERLETGLRQLPQIKIAHPRQTNSVFAQMPAPVVKGMHDLGWKFYTHVSPGDARLMCSWDITEADVDAFVADVKGLLR